MKEIPIEVKSAICEAYGPCELPLKVYFYTSCVCLLVDMLTSLVCLIMASKFEWAIAMVYIC